MPASVSVNVLSSSVMRAATPSASTTTWHTAQDKGSPWFGGTGNGSYFYLASDSGDAVHQVFATREGCSCMRKLASS